MISLNRTELVARLEEMAQAGSLLVVGGPGAGKSWLLQQFARQREKAGDAVLLLLAEEHNYVESLRQLEQSLAIPAGIIPTLKAYTGLRRFLIIDSLDSLRAEASQRVFRDLIRQVHRELPDWKVIASIRSFDLKESIELQKLFAGNGAAVKGEHNLTARHLVVPVFDDDELVEVVRQDPRLLSVLSSASAELRQILRNAFNLWLVVHLLDENANIDWLYEIESEVQLLERYWRYRISGREDSHDRIRILTDVTSEMVTSRTLSVPFADSYKTVGGAAIFQSLLSDEILRKTFTQRVAYAHNILFDFSVSKLLLDEVRFFPFLRDPARSIFFRPSVSYFLGLLWYRDRNLFWGVVSDFFITGDLPTRLSVIPGMTVFHAATNSQDLEPLLDASSKVGPEATLSVLRAVQAFDGLTSRRARVWLQLLCELSKRLDITFLNEFLALVETASRQQSWSPDERKLLVAASIRLLHWMWRTAQSASSKANSDQLLSIAAGRVIPIVMGFFPDDAGSVRMILNQILERIGRPDVSASEAYSLARSLETVIDTDPSAAVDVYAATFSHHEKSQKPTSIGGKVLQLRSTRAQDYSMAYYLLNQRFAYFLQRNLTAAASAAIRSITAEVKRDHARMARRMGHYSAQFQFEELRAKLIADRSEIWDRGGRDDNSLDLLERLLSFLAEGLKTGSISPNTTWGIFKLVAKENQYPVVWKRTLEYANRSPELLPFVLPLLHAPEILIAPETTIVAGNLISQHFTTFPPDAKRAIESAIWMTPNTSVSKLYHDANRERDRLIACMPEHERSDRSRRAVDEAKSQRSLKENRPLVEIGSASFAPLRDDYWLKQQGIDPDSEPNRNLLELRSILATFQTKYVNETPSLQEIETIFPQLQDCFERVRSVVGADDQVKTDVFTAVAAVAKSILKNGKLTQESPVVRLCRAIIADAAIYPLPQPLENADEKFDRPIWSPTPSIEAAQAIIHFVSSWGLDNDLESLLRTLSANKSPEVRFQIAVGLGSLYNRKRQLFWDIADSMLSAERTTGVLEALARTVGQPFIAQHEPEAVVERFRRLLTRALPKQRRGDVLEAVVDSLIQLHVYLDSRSADKLLRKFEKIPLRYAQQLHTMGWSASHYLTYKIETDGPATSAVRSRALQVELRVLSAIDRGFQKLETGNKTSAQAARRRNEAANQLLLAVDRLALRLHTLTKELAQVKLGEGHALAVFLKESASLWDALVSAGTDYRRPMAPSTAHQLMESFNFLLQFDPAHILRLAARLITGRTFGYHFDELAIGEFVKFAEKILADHKELLRDPTNAVRFGEILDVFVSAGWPAATQIVTRLDAAVR